jgi:[NiFe] hydrogenase diaphorase moiety small subunit
MNSQITFSIDGKEYGVDSEMYIVEAAKQNGVYIPTLCNIAGEKPRGACRICTVKVNGKMMAACTTPVAKGMKIENNTPELTNLRKLILETLFVEGNHFCPSCEKSGNCELQALGYRFGMLVPRFPYQFPIREIEATNPKLIKDHNRCVLCKRCIRMIKDEKGRSLFAFKRRSHRLTINIDTKLSASISDELAQKAMDVCPVGAILKKERGFIQPIGSRKYDKKPIGSEIERTA